MVSDGTEQFFFIFTIERRLSSEHFEEENTIGPPIDAFAIFLIQNDLHDRMKTIDPSIC